MSATEVPTLLVSRHGEVLDANTAAEALVGPAVGGACEAAVRGVTSGGVLCGDGCSATLLKGGVPRSTLCGGHWAGTRRLVCSPLGEHVVVRMEAVPQVSTVDHLTPREHEVLILVAQGLTTAQVAKRLGVSFATARTHLEHIREKLGARTRAEAVARAMALGWLDGSDDRKAGKYGA